MRTHILFRLCAIALAATSVLAQAQTSNDPLKAAVERAIVSNPDVSSRYNAYNASLDAIDIARAPWLPRVDVDASLGRDNARIKNQLPANQTVSRNAVGIGLSQLLWDGLGTRADVERFGHERLARYFELLDTTEQTALEAARAFYDVQRYRELVRLAEDNYVQHKYAMLQIRSRVQAGVGRGVDLEQATARFTLAESNLTAELSNLHDVSARYLRVVGELPPADLTASADLAASLPATPEDMLRGAIDKSAAISATIESLRSARSSVKLRQAAFQPRVEARLHAGVGNNVDGIVSERRNSTAELVLSWNLFNGGADQARVRQQTHLLDQAADQRDKACRDTRQTASIAFNDTRKLVEQIGYLEQNTGAIERTRDAYRQQFDIGQRSLLDLLNAENEVYTARRSLANARFDRVTAHARSQAALTQLTTQLGLTRPMPADSAANDWSADGDAPGRCPVLAIEVRATPLQTLDQRADKLMENKPVPGATPRR